MKGVPLGYPADLHSTMETQGHTRIHTWLQGDWIRSTPLIKTILHSKIPERERKRERCRKRERERERKGKNRERKMERER